MFGNMSVLSEFQRSGFGCEGLRVIMLLSPVVKL